MFIAPMAARQAETNGRHFRRRIAQWQTGSGIPLAARPQRVGQEGPLQGVEVRQAPAGRLLAAIGPQVESVRPGVFLGRVTRFGKTLRWHETPFPLLAHYPTFAAP